MTFIKAMTLVFNHIHTILFVLGLVLVVSSVMLLFGIEWGLLVMGLSLVTIALIINSNMKGGE